MDKKLFYQQPEIRVLTVHTEGLMVGFSGKGYGTESEEDWDNEDE